MPNESFDLAITEAENLHGSNEVIRAYTALINKALPDDLFLTSGDIDKLVDIIYEEATNQWNISSAFEYLTVFIQKYGKALSDGNQLNTLLHYYRKIQDLDYFVPFLNTCYPDAPPPDNVLKHIFHSWLDEGDESADRRDIVVQALSKCNPKRYTASSPVVMDKIRTALISFMARNRMRLTFKLPLYTDYLESRHVAELSDIADLIVLLEEHQVTHPNSPSLTEGNYFSVFNLDPGSLSHVFCGPETSHNRPHTFVQESAVALMELSKAGVPIILRESVSTLWKESPLAEAKELLAKLAEIRKNYPDMDAFLKAKAANLHEYKRLVNDLATGIAMNPPKAQEEAKPSASATSANQSAPEQLPELATRFSLSVAPKEEKVATNHQPSQRRGVS